LYLLSQPVGVLFIIAPHRPRSQYLIGCRPECNVAVLVLESLEFAEQANIDAKNS